MTLDELSPVHEHRRLVRNMLQQATPRTTSGPEWDLAVKTQRDDAAQARADWLDRELCESPEAEAAHWRGIFQGQAKDMPGPYIYARDRG